MEVGHTGCRILEKERPEQGKISPGQLPGLRQNLGEKGGGEAAGNEVSFLGIM